MSSSESGAVFQVPIRDVMRRPAETASPPTTAREIARHLHEADVGSVVIVDDGPVGVVTDSDVLALVAAGRSLDETAARDCMSAPVVTVGADDSIESAAETLRDHGIDQVPVLDDGSLVGVVSVRELSYYLPALSFAEVGTPEASEVEFAYEDRAEPGLDVGDVARFSKRLTDSDVRAFARASGDDNPLHLDDSYAAETRFGGRIAHGVLTLGVVSAALTRLPGLVVYLSQTARFVAPVDVGSRVTAVCEVVEALGRDRYRLRTQVLGSDDTVVIDGEAVVWADTDHAE